MPGEATLKFYQGGTKVFLVTHKSTTGTVRDYTGCTFACTGKAAHSDTATTFTLTTANGGVSYPTIDGVKKIQLNFTDEITAAVPSGQGVWDLFAFTATGESLPILFGQYLNQRKVPSPNV
jgi:hypothetical protein